MPFPSPYWNSPLEPYYIIVLKPQRTCVAWLVFSRRSYRPYTCSDRAALHHTIGGSLPVTTTSNPQFSPISRDGIDMTFVVPHPRSLVCVQIRRYIVVASIDAWRNEQTDGIRRNNDGIYLSRVSPLILAANTMLGVRWDLLLAALHYTILLCALVCVLSIAGVHGINQIQRRDRWQHRIYTACLLKYHSRMHTISRLYYFYAAPHRYECSLSLS
jgi:hypothetical protein